MGDFPQSLEPVQLLPGNYQGRPHGDSSAKDFGLRIPGANSQGTLLAGNKILAADLGVILPKFPDDVGAVEPETDTLSIWVFNSGEAASSDTVRYEITGPSGTTFSSGQTPALAAGEGRLVQAALSVKVENLEPGTQVRINLNADASPLARECVATDNSKPLGLLGRR